ncbi:hypothetical protein [Acidithiobacillus albertensis]|uniref:hypothetical protein n=1 Tax=Acidithiobacillus albertensis TaxID=119978 RepID=UPI00094ABBE5|nr:hypothetical protein [Acidithiobacillus albertensis]MDD2749416.1 hypothetical protein [Acidithiobacillus sp.]
MMDVLEVVDKGGLSIKMGESDRYARLAALYGLHHLGVLQNGYAEDAPVDLHLSYSVLSAPPENAALRDMEPVLGYFLRHADPADDLAWLMDAFLAAFDAGNWAVVQRGGYVLDLLCFFSDDLEQWQKKGLLLRLNDYSEKLPREIPEIAYFPQDSRKTAHQDFIVRRWHLSSGALYDRLKQLLRPPYVC